MRSTVRPVLAMSFYDQHKDAEHQGAMATYGFGSQPYRMMVDRAQQQKQARHVASKYTLNILRYRAEQALEGIAQVLQDFLPGLPSSSERTIEFSLGQEAKLTPSRTKHWHDPAYFSQIRRKLARINQFMEEGFAP